MPLLDNHVYDVSHMLGLATEGSEDSKGFYASHDIEDTPGAQEVAMKVANGSVTKASIGFVPVQESWEQDVKGEVTRTLHEVKLFENSVVLHPANEATNIWAKGTRYRGLAKNTAQLFTLFGFANLVLAGRRFRVTETRVAS